MRLYIDLPLETNALVGMCEACGSNLKFDAIDDGAGYNYYTAEDLVNKWMDHQLNDCKPPVIDNPGGIGYSDFVTTQTLEVKVGSIADNPPVEDDDEDEDGYDYDEEYDEDDEEDDDDLR